MQIKETQESNVTTLEIQGRLDSLTSTELLQRVTKLVDAGTTNLIFDLAGLNYVNSTGLRVFLGTAKQLESRGGKIVISGIRNEVKDVFEISGFSALFEIYSSPEEARKSFS